MKLYMIFHLLTRFLQRIETALFDHLAYNFIGYLIAPFIDDRHVYIIDKNGHGTLPRRSVTCANSLLHIGLNNAL